jgi:predicted nucleotidyltransferase
MELIKPIVKVGNSAGVILPREWLNGKAKIELIAKPLNIKNEIFEMLEEYLSDVVGIYLVGSYARGEETEGSDIDVLVITNKINKRIEKGKYNLILISLTEIKDALETNILPILPMIKEAKPLLNGNLINLYNKTKLTNKNLSWHIKITKSALKVNRASLNLSREMDSKYMGDATSYSLVLHLRSLYIVDCLIKNKQWSNKELLSLIKRITGSFKSYQGYLRVKTHEKSKEELPIEEAEKLFNYIGYKITEQEKWVKKER